MFVKPVTSENVQVNYKIKRIRYVFVLTEKQQSAVGKISRVTVLLAKYFVIPHPSTEQDIHSPSREPMDLMRLVNTCFAALESSFRKLLIGLQNCVKVASKPKFETAY